MNGVMTVELSGARTDGSPASLSISLGENT